MELRFGKCSGSVTQSQVPGGHSAHGSPRQSPGRRRLLLQNRKEAADGAVPSHARPHALLFLLLGHHTHLGSLTFPSPLPLPPSAKSPPDIITDRSLRYLPGTRRGL